MCDLLSQAAGDGRGLGAATQVRRAPLRGLAQRFDCESPSHRLHLAREQLRQPLPRANAAPQNAHGRALRSSPHDRAPPARNLRLGEFHRHHSSKAGRASRARDHANRELLEKLLAG